MPDAQRITRLRGRLHDLIFVGDSMARTILNLPDPVLNAFDLVGTWNHAINCVERDPQTAPLLYFIGDVMAQRLESVKDATTCGTRSAWKRLREER